MKHKKSFATCCLLLIVISILHINSIKTNDQDSDMSALCYKAAGLLGAFFVWKAFPWTKKKISSDPLVKLLGYNPEIKHTLDIPSKDKTIKEFDGIPLSTATTKTPVVTSMGFGDGPNTYRGRFNTDKTFTITFNYQDSYIKSLYTLGSLRVINLGQEHDARALLYVITQCYKKGFKKIHIFGHSRGGATIIKMLDMLSNPQKYSEIWKSFGITNKQTQEKIKAMVAAGTIHVAHPLMNQREAVQCHTGITLQPVGTFLLEQFTHYRDPKETPLKIIETNIKNPKVWPYTITAAYAEKDTVVGDSHIVPLRKLSQKHDNFSLLKGGKNHIDVRDQVRRFREKLTQIERRARSKITILPESTINKTEQVKVNEPINQIMQNLAQALKQF